MKRVCYGLVIPGLIIGVTLYAHIPAKYGMFLSLISRERLILMYSLRTCSAQYSSSYRKHHDSLGCVDVSDSAYLSPAQNLS